MWPGCLATIFLTSRLLSPVGSMNPPPVQAELREYPGDGAAAYRCSCLLHLEGDAGYGPLVLTPHRLDLLNERPGCGGGLSNGS